MPRCTAPTCKPLSSLAQLRFNHVTGRTMRLTCYPTPDMPLAAQNVVYASMWEAQHGHSAAVAKRRDDRSCTPCVRLVTALCCDINGVQAHQEAHDGLELGILQVSACDVEVGHHQNEISNKKGFEEARTRKCMTALGTASCRFLRAMSK